MLKVCEKCGRQQLVNKQLAGRYVCPDCRCQATSTSPQSVVSRSPQGHRSMYVELLFLAGVIAALWVGMNTFSSRSGKPPMAISAEKLSAEYARNGVAAAEEFQDRTLVVTGEILTVRMIKNVPSVTVAGSGPVGAILCRWDHNEEARSLRPGDVITFVGTCLGDQEIPSLGPYGMVVMDDCRLQK